LSENQSIAQIIKRYSDDISEKRKAIRKLEDQIIDLEDLKTIYLSSLVGADIIEEINCLKERR